MQVLWDLAPLLGAMLVLTTWSAFFSGSEAALFSLRTADRVRMESGSRAARRAIHLLEDPDRLLSAVLFWNLLINLVYFGLATRIDMQLSANEQVSSSEVMTFRLGSLLMLIFWGEMLPKSVAVLRARQLAQVISLPLAFTIRLIDPLMPTLRVVNTLSRRLLWPTFKPEPYLDVNDLARAIELSTADEHLIAQEQDVLRNVVLLSDTRADECMRPRSQIVTFRPPVAWSAISQNPPPSGFLLVTEPDSEEVVLAVDLYSLTEIPEQHLERYAKPVVYIPWCANVASVADRLENKDADVAVVVNELGETIGIVTRKDLLDIVFMSKTSRSERLLNLEPIQQIDADVWQVTGLTNLRALADHFKLELPPTGSVTVAGVLQESLQRLPEVGDHCRWGPLDLQLVERPDDAPWTIHIRLTNGDA